MVSNRGALWELQERVKELTLLQHATRLLQNDNGLEAAMQELVALMPAGWQFPHLAQARITIGDLVVATPRFRVTPWLLRAELPMHTAQPGVLEVAYLEAPPVGTSEPFLPEEQSLMTSLASVLVSHFERARRAEERLDLARAQAARAEAEAANRMKDAFLAIVSHELRRPLTVILGWTRMLRAGDSGRGLQVIERNAMIQLRLIEELLDLSRTATGRLGATLSPVDLNAILRQVAEAAGPAASEQRVEVVTNFKSDYTPVLGDSIRLQQIVGNLMGNAIKFTPGGGSVTMTLDRVGPCAQIEIADTGVGIETAALPHVFEPMWQVNPATSPSREGLGLGLAIVQRLVELHGGTIEAHSGGAAPGTRMIVRLPLAPQPTTPGASARA